MNDEKDQLYTLPMQQLEGFTFDKRVAQVFPDMINRSVPAYATIVDMIGLLANRFATPGSNCYDLGCSLGATSFAMHEGVKNRQCKIIAVDNSIAMIERFKTRLSNEYENIEPVIADIRDINFSNCSFAALNFTLQFLPVADRANLLSRIYNAMLPGACLVLSEKITFPDAKESEFHDELHELFKRANGYSDLEIAQKRTALENVLIRESLDVHHSRLGKAGFDRSYTWFQCFNFVSLVAFRD